MDTSFERKKNSQEWYTPIDILEGLGLFDLDPCTSTEAINYNDSAKNYFTAEDDGLTKEWFGRIWLNPPYDNIEAFMEKMANHNNGIALTFNRSDTKWYHNFVKGKAVGIFQIKGRLKFLDQNINIKSTAGAASILIIYGIENLKYFENYKKEGLLIIL